eukprot:5095302-Prymnesium_polylepis.1
MRRARLSRRACARPCRRCSAASSASRRRRRCRPARCSGCRSAEAGRVCGLALVCILLCPTYTRVRGRRRAK